MMKQRPISSLMDELQNCSFDDDVKIPVSLEKEQPSPRTIDVARRTKTEPPKLAKRVVSASQRRFIRNKSPLLPTQLEVQPANNMSTPAVLLRKKTSSPSITQLRNNTPPIPEVMRTPVKKQVTPYPKLKKLMIRKNSATTDDGVSQNSDSSGSSAESSRANTAQLSRSAGGTPNIPYLDPNLVIGSSSIAIVAAIQLGSVASEHTEEEETAILTTSNVSAAETMLMQLLVSETMLEVAPFSIIPAENVESMKAERKRLTAQLISLHNKLSLESRIREAALLLTKPDSSSTSQQAKEGIEQLGQANKNVEKIAVDLMDATSSLIKLERVYFKHLAAVLNQNILLNQKCESEELSIEAHGEAALLNQRQIDSAESRIKEQEQVIKVLESTISRLESEQQKSVNPDQLNTQAADAERVRLLERKIKDQEEEIYFLRSSKSFQRKMSIKSSEAPTPAEYNRLKLDLATTRSELAVFKEEFSAAKENITDLTLKLSDDQTTIENKNRTISNLLGELEMLETQVDMQHAASSGDASTHTLTTTSKGQIGVLETKYTPLPPLDKDDGVEKLRGVEDQAAVSCKDNFSDSGAKKQSNSKTVKLCSAVESSSDTETEDEYSGFGSIHNDVRSPTPSFQQHHYFSLQHQGGETMKKLHELQEQIQILETERFTLHKLHQRVSKECPPTFEVNAFTESVINLLNEKLKLVETAALAEDRRTLNESEINNLQQELKRSLQEVQEAHALIKTNQEEHAASCTRYQESVRLLEEDVKSYKVRVNGAEDDFSVVSDKLNSLKASIRDQGREMEEVQDKLRGKESELRTMKEELEAKIAELEREHMAELDALNDKHTAELNQLEASLRDLSDDHAQRTQEFEKRHAQVIDDYEALLQRERSLITSVLAQTKLLESTVDITQKKLDRSKADYLATKRDLESKEQKQLELSTKYTAAKEELGKMSLKFEKRMKALQEELELANQLQVSLTNDLDSMQVKFTALEERYQQALRNIKELETKMAANQSVEDCLLREIETMQDSIVALKTEKAGLLEMTDDQQLVIDGNKVQLQALRSEVEQLQASLESSENEHTNSMQSIVREIRLLESRNDAHVQKLKLVENGTLPGEDVDHMKLEVRKLLMELRKEFEMNRSKWAGEEVSPSKTGWFFSK